MTFDIKYLGLAIIGFIILVGFFYLLTRLLKLDSTEDEYNKQMMEEDEYEKWRLENE